MSQHFYNPKFWNQKKNPIGLQGAISSFIHSEWFSENGVGKWKVQFQVLFDSNTIVWNAAACTQAFINHYI